MAHWRAIYVALLLVNSVLAAVHVWAQVQPGSIVPGDVVEEVAKNSEAEKAGLQQGDILLHWSRGSDHGELISPFDLSFIEIEQAPRGNVTLEGLRGTETRTWVIGPDDWGIKTRPNLPQNLLSIYLEGEELAKAGKLEDAAQRWHAAAVEAQQSFSPQLEVWFLFHSAERLANAGAWKQADNAYQESTQEAAGTAIAVQVLNAWAATFKRRSDWSNAEKYYRQALAESRKPGTDNLMTALILSGLGTMANERGNQAEAERYHTDALEIRERLSPGSLAVASSLQNLGVAAQDHGDLAKEEKYLRQALAIGEKLAPGGLPSASSFNQLGYWYWIRGDLINAEEYFRRGFMIRQKLDPDSLDFATSLNNLGIIAFERSDLDDAERYYQQSLALREKLSPESLDVGRSLNNLAGIAHNRGDLATAIEYYRRALAICLKVTPNNRFIPQILDNLGELARARGDLAMAEEYHRQGLETAKRISPDNVYVAISLECLGRVADDRGESIKAERYFHQALALYNKISPHTAHYYSAGVLRRLGMVREARSDLDGAEQYYRQALALREKVSSSSLDVAEVLDLLGDVARTRGDLDQAEQYYRRSLAIREKSSPGSSDHARVLAALAGIRRKQKFEDAAGLYEQALNAFESQTARLGGSEDVRSRFRASSAGYYKDYIDLLVAQNKPVHAFEVLERSRARSLLETLAEGGVDIRKGVDAGVVRQEHLLQAKIAAKTDERVRLLSDSHTEEQIGNVEKEIHELVSQYDGVEEQIRTASPAYTALLHPQSLTAEQVQQQLLDTNTLLLEYSLGQERSYVFAVTPDSLAAYELPKQSEIESLARKVHALLIARGHLNPNETTVQRKARIAKADAEYTHAIAKLSESLLGPVASLLEEKRLLVVADGALQYIPFSVLTEPGKPSRAPLMVAHEIVNLPSASVLAVLRRQEAERKQPSKTVAVLADPVFTLRDARVQGERPWQLANKRYGVGIKEPAPADLSQDLLTRSARDIGFLSLPRLPFTRQEADAIMSVTPAGEGLKAVDFQANRELSLSAELANYRIVHLATHGLVDSEHPELSGLVLSLVDKQGRRQDGFLGLEDIYNLDLPVDMVVLSACETGLGKEINGEGLIGLTRGFMYAGAKRVVASLWSVDDVATAELMGRFYKGMLQQGRSPAAALRQAQVEMWKQKRWHTPYYWGAFVLQGEWKPPNSQHAN